MKKLTKNIQDFLIAHPLRCLFFSAVIGLFLMAGLIHFKEEYDVRIWFRTTDPNLKKLDQFEKQFGSDEGLITVLHHPDGIFQKGIISDIKKLTTDLYQVQNVIRVESLTNFMDSKALGDDIIVEPFIPAGFDYAESSLKKKELEARSHNIMSGYLINKEGTTAVVLARLKPRLGGINPDYSGIDRAHKEILSRIDTSNGLVTHVTGSAAINNSFQEVSAKDLQLMIPIVNGLIILILLFIFRSIKSMLIPLAMIGVAIFSTLGFMSWSGIFYNEMISAVPGILIAICIADSVHLMVTFFQGRQSGLDRFESARFTIDKNLRPTFLTSVTTSLGFMSLATTDLNPIKHMGILASFGTMLAWTLTFTIVVPLLVLIPLKVPPVRKKEVGLQTVSPNYYKLVDFIHKYALVIIFIFISSSGTFAYLAFQNEVNSNPFEYFKEHHHLYKANKFHIKEFGGTSGPEVVLESGKPDGIKEPAFLKKVETLNTWLLSKDHIPKSVSILDIIKSMNQSLHEGDPAFYTIPPSSKAVAEVLFLYTMGLPQGMDLNNRMTLDNEKMRMTLMWKTQDSRTYVKQVARVNQKIIDLGLRGEVNGKMPLYQKMNGYVVDTFVKSMGLAIFLITVLMSLVFKSIKMGILSMFPNIMPLTYGMGVMFLLGVPVDLGTSLVTSVCLGIAVDDTIHFLNAYTKSRNSGQSVRDSLAHLFQFTGPALVITTVILVLGFGIFVIGDFMPNVHFGALTAIGLSMALLIDLIFLPALLITMERFTWFKKRSVEKAV
ncbi:MAG: MMPL family transporter [Bacteriovoracaceae bacterium]|nr:MMPL family transporter [Bacteriovoracaceae bacterium]